MNTDDAVETWLRVHLGSAPNPIAAQARTVADLTGITGMSEVEARIAVTAAFRRIRDAEGQAAPDPPDDNRETDPAKGSRADHQEEHPVTDSPASYTAPPDDDFARALAAWQDPTPADWFHLAVCLEAIPLGWSEDKCDRFARHWWPLAYYKIKGIGQGEQWRILGWLAARYSRDLPVTDLADELWQVMEASPQDARNPWRRHHAVDIAARAQRFTEREDEKLHRMLTDSGAYAWAMSVTRALPDHPAPRPERQPGQRRMRQPGRAA